ncbi:MAG: MBL fold metallo-hydrolase [Oscillospiraceae bacterium]|jgi:glyoxylase-like metal-dependent hydrolase (beta-lactamase superfamily II)|nr:MBL fold metallo-hydrolase [Oscillospiraceae bacterium]
MDNVVKLEEGVWRVDPGMSAAFLVVGEESALLIDAGVGQTNVLENARTVTDKPIRLVLTHGHGDHTGGAKYFDEVFAGEKEKLQNVEQKVNRVSEGFEFDLGGRVLKVVDIPGHTPGSIGLYDEAAGAVFTGDMVSQSPIFFIAGERNEDAFIASMDKLLALPADRFFCAHGPSVCGRDTVEKLKKAAALFRDGKLEAKQGDGPFPGVVYLSEDGVGFRVVEFKK